MKLSERSLSVCSESVLLLRLSCTMGTLEALYCRMSGGVVPGGNWRNCVCETAVICATAMSIFTVGMEVDLHHRDAVERLRLDVLDVVDRGGQRALRDGDDALLHLLRREAGVVPDDADDRDVDVRENVDRRGQRRIRTTARPPMSRTSSAATTKV